MMHFSERIPVVKQPVSVFPLTAIFSIISCGNIIFDLCLRFQEHSQGVNEGLRKVFWTWVFPLHYTFDMLHKLFPAFVCVYAAYCIAHISLTLFVL
jgi:hypothetical protein